MDRKTIKKVSPQEADDGGFVSGTAAERISLVWELTKSAWAFMGENEFKCRRDHVIAGACRSGDRV